MKAKALQFGKAMSAALFVLLLSVAGMKNALAQTQVATLQHGDDMTAFYGMNALVNAHSAATDGDIITLSSGTFAPTFITKAITLHGAGCTADTLDIAPSIISNGFSIRIPNSSLYLIMEGVCIQGEITYTDNLHYAKFIKCKIKKCQHGSETNHYGYMTKDIQFINCMFDEKLDISSSTQTNISLINCIVNRLQRSGSADAYINIYNSYIKSISSSKWNLINSILGESEYTISNSYAYNCIEIGSVFQNDVQTFSCMTVNSYSDIFESFDGTFSDDSDFHLKQEIATTFLGNDGREVGIYGGVMPYNTRPSYLILNRCNVANKSTIDGKLSVDIEVISNGGE